MYRYLVLICLFFHVTAFAGIQNLLKEIVPEGTISNVNKSGAVQDQSGGFITGGSIIMRGPQAKEIHPFNIQLPSFKFDPCTGSGDFRFGSMSYISGKEFTEFFKGITRAAGAYATKLLIKTLSPISEDVMSQLESIVRDINGMSMNQCAIAQNIVDGALSKVSNSSKLGCMMRSNTGNKNADLFASSAACQDDQEKYKDTGKEEVKSLLGDNFNLAWKALTNSGGQEKKSAEFLEFMMSVSGTIIGQKKDGVMKYSIKSSLFTDEEQIEKYIGNASGSTVNIYQCDNIEICLNPKIVTTTLKPENAFFSQITKIMEGITQKVANNNEQAFTPEEQSLVNFSSIPIITMIEQELILKGIGRVAVSSELIEVICYDVVVGYLDNLLNRVDKGVSTLELAQIDKSVLYGFKNDIAKVKTGFFNKKITAFERANIVMQAKEHMKLQQKAIKDRFSRIVANTTIN